MVDALRYDRGIPFFGDFFFWMTGLLNPKSSEITPFFFCVMLIVYLGHRIFHPGQQFIFSPRSVLGRGLTLQK